MPTLNLATLIQKLNPTTKQSLEQATALCLKRQHYDVELEHWLLVLLEEQNTDFTKILLQSGCELSKICQGINHNLEKLKIGNAQTPAISQRLIEWINEAWLLASLAYDQVSIDSGRLLLALVQEPILNQLCLNISTEFNKLELETVKQRLLELEEIQESTPKPEKIQKSKLNALDQYTINLNQQAAEGKLDNAVYRELEIQQVLQILARRRQNNAILVGEPGVGKTAIVEGLALCIHQGDVPDLLKQVKLHSLDLGLLQAGASIKGEFEKRLKALIQDIKNAPCPIVLFIDEAHMLVGAGGQSGQNDAANLLKPALARGELHSIAATTWKEYKQYFENDAALTRRFQVVKVPEPDIAGATFMLRSMALQLEKHHQILILDEAIQQAVALSARYISDRFLPDKAISVLDTACARVAGQHNTTPGAIELQQRHLTQLELEKTQLVKETAQGIVHKLRLAELDRGIIACQQQLDRAKQNWHGQSTLVKKMLSLAHQLRAQQIDKTKIAQQKELQKQLVAAQKNLEKLQKYQRFIRPYVDSVSVASVIADWTTVPVGNILKDQAEQMLALEQTLKSKIIGQERAVTQIAAEIKTAGAKLKDPNKPLGIFFFVGPSGVGKTETALVLAENLFSSKDKIITLNMSEFKEAHKVALLTGAPPGYVGYGEGGLLTEAVRRKPYSIVLLDEMEKAHPSVQDIFYQVFDKGVLQDSQGRKVDFRNTLIIMTANSCSQLITHYWQQDPAIKDFKHFFANVNHELLQSFKPAFLGRVHVVPYLPLADIAVTQIAEIKLEQIKQRLDEEHHIALDISAQAVQAIVELCRNHLIGARQIDAILQQEFLPQLATLVLQQLTHARPLSAIKIDVTETGTWQFKTIAAKQMRKTSKMEAKVI